MLASGNITDAAEAIETAHRLGPGIDAISALRADILLRNGQAETVAEELLDLVKESPLDFSLHALRLEMAFAQGKPAQAEELSRAYAQLLRKQAPNEADELIARSGAYLLYLRGDSRALAYAGQQRPEDMWIASLLRGDALRRLDAEAVLKAPPPQGVFDILGAAIVLHATGKTAQATAQRDRAVELLTTGRAEEALAAQLLKQGAKADADVAADLSMVPDVKAVVLVALVQSGADKRLLTLAEKLTTRPVPTDRTIRTVIQRSR